MYRVIAKQQAKRGQTHPVFSHAVEKYEKLKSINTQNDQEATSKKWTDKNKTNLFSMCFVKSI